MAQRTAALPEEMMNTITAASMHFLVGTTGFDESLYAIAGSIANARDKADPVFGQTLRAALSGIAAGMAIGKHIERQRYKAMRQTEEKPADGSDRQA